MSTGILKAEGVCKSYGKKEVLHNLDLTIEPGKIYGLIGRNGAGKTTLLGILTGQNTMDAGSVTYDGAPVWENRAALDNLCFSRELSPNILFGQNNTKVRDYFRDPEHRRKFEQWHLETYGEPYVWRPLGGGTHGQ